MKFKNYLQPDTLDKIKELADKGYNVRNIGKELNIPEKRVSDITNHFKIEMRKNFTHQINHSFFKSIDSELKYYIIGFIIADGNISKKIGNRQQRLSFNNSIDDLETIELMRDTLIPDYKLKTFNNSNETITRKNQIVFKLSSQEIADDLQKLGILPNKTEDIEFEILSKIPTEYKRHLIRGFLDGDGHVGKSNVSFVCTSLKFLQEIEKEFLNLGVTTRMREDFNKSRYYILYLNTGHEKRNIVFSYLYEDSNHYLSRKKAKFF